MSLLLTAIWLFCIHALPDVQVFRAEGVLLYILVALQITGAIIIIAALLPIDIMAFLGFRRSVHDVEQFVISGIYRYLRHPMYSGVMLMLLASPLQSINSLSMTLAVALYFFTGSRLEERRMLEYHPEYAAYRRSVPAFLPHFWGWWRK